MESKNYKNRKTLKALSAIFALFLLITICITGCTTKKVVRRKIVKKSDSSQLQSSEVISSSDVISEPSADIITDDTTDNDTNTENDDNQYFDPEKGIIATEVVNKGDSSFADDAQNNNYVKDNWGDSKIGDGKYGDWTINSENDISLDTPEGPTWAVLYYNKKMQNYKYSIKVKSLEQGVTSSYPKFGVFGAYVDAGNYYAAFIDPQYSVLATYGLINGEPMNWQNSPINIDLTKEIEITVYKIGHSIKVYINGSLIQSRTVNIDECQVGVVTEDYAASYKNIIFESASNFPPVAVNDLKFKWGSNTLTGNAKTGNWEISDEKHVSINDTSDGFKILYYDNKAKNYSFSVDAKYKSDTGFQYAKFGIIPAIKDSDNYLYTFIDQNRNMLAAWGFTNGVELPWVNSSAGISDMKATINIKAVKIDGEIRIYVNGKRVQKFKYDTLDDITTVGLITEQTAVDYSNPVFEPATVFPDGDLPTEETGWGDAENGIGADSGFAVASAAKVTGSEISNSGGFKRLYKAGKGSNYKVSADITFAESGTFRYAKFGLMGAYVDESNYLYVFVDRSAGCIASVADSTTDTDGAHKGWRNDYIPFTNLNDKFNLKVIRIGNEFRFYIDNKYVASRTIKLGDAQTGVIVEDSKAVFDNYTLTSATQFDNDGAYVKNISGFGDGDKVIAQGYWTVDSQTGVSALGTIYDTSRLVKKGAISTGAFELTAKAKLIKMTGGEYPKYGLAAYADDANFIQAYIDPKYKVLATRAVAGGTDLGWKNINADGALNEIDFTVPNTVKLIKRDAAFEVYINGTYIGKRVVNELSSKAFELGFVADSADAQFTDIDILDHTVTPPHDETNVFGWGNSASGTVKSDGFAITSASELSYTKLQNGGGFNEIFKEGSKSDYKFSFDIKFIEKGTFSQSKAGAYAIYKDSGNFVGVFFNANANCFSTWGRVNGVDQGWTDTDLPFVDLFTTLNIKTIKVGNEFRFYINNMLVQTRSFNIDAGQIGLVSEDIKADYTNINVADTTAFDDSVPYDFKNSTVDTNYGQQGNYSSNGRWIIENGKITAQSGPGFKNLYKKGVFTDDYRFSADMKMLSRGIGDYPKYGISAKGDNGFVYAFIDFFNKDKPVIAIHSNINGKWFNGNEWNSIDIGAIDLTATHNMKIEQVGADILIYLDNNLVATIKDSALTNAVYSLACESCTTEYTNIVSELISVNWGDSAADAKMSGNWSFASKTMVTQSQIDNGDVNRIIFRPGLETNYKFSAKAQLLGDGTFAYRKYGFYAAYKDNNNFVWVFLDRTYRGIATFAKVNGVDQGWQNTNLRLVDFEKPTELKVIRIGNEIRIYVNGEFATSRTLPEGFGASQVGLITIDSKVTFSDIAYQKLETSSTFDESTGPLNEAFGFGDNMNGIGPGGYWDVQSETAATIKGTDGGWDRLFKTQHFTGDFTFSADAKWLSTDAGQYQKYGIMVYNAENTHVTLWIDCTAQFSTSFAIVGGSDLGWQNKADLVINKSEFNNLKIKRTGTNYQFYLNNQLVMERTINITGDVQMALVVEKSKAEFKNITASAD